MIEVLVNYGGKNTNWKRIPQGTYAEDAPELFGLAEYLVSGGWARRIIVTPAIPVDEPTSTATSEALDIADAQHTPKTARKRKGGD